MAFPSVYFDIKKQNNIIPIDYFIPTLFRNHAVERSMYDRIGIHINNRLAHPSFNNIQSQQSQQQLLPVNYYTQQQQQQIIPQNNSSNKNKHKRRNRRRTVNTIDSREYHS